MESSFKIIVLAAIISFAACKNKKNNQIGSKTEYAYKNNGDANEIVEYNNVLVSFTDRNNDYLKRLDNALTRINKGLENPADRFAFVGIIEPFDIPTATISKIKPDTPPSVLNSSDQNYFKENVTALTTTLGKIKEAYKLLNDYIKAEDFKDDKSLKGKLIIDSIYIMSEQYYAYNNKILKKLEIIGNDAERIILKSHPLKDYILVLKDDRKAVTDFNNLIISNQNYKEIEGKAKSAYEALQKQNKIHSSMNVPDVKKYPGSDGAFKRFNDSFNEYLVEARKVMRDASSSGKLTKANVEDLVRKQDYMRTAYNSFVN